MEQTDRSKTRRARSDARSGIFHCYSANGKNGNPQRLADFAEPLDSLRSAERRLGRRRENGSEKNIICTGALGRARALQGMARRADTEIRALGATPPLRHHFYRQGCFPQVHPRRARRERDIQTVVDLDARSCAPCVSDCEAHEFQENARLKVLFANLNPVDSSGCRLPDGFEQYLQWVWLDS